MLEQKLLLLAIFLLAPLGAHRLAIRAKALVSYPYAAYAAGLFYVCNPFVYSRFMTGQWMVLLGYALLPWAVAALYDLMQKPDFGRAWRAWAWSVAVAFVSIHAVGFVMLAGLVLFAVRGRQEIKRRTVWSAALAAAWVVANAIWLFPALTGHGSSLADEVGGFGPAQLQAFATVGTIHGSVPLTSLLLEGFWHDAQFRYAIPSLTPTWWLGVALLAPLIVYGAYRVIRQRDMLGVALLVLGLVAWWLALGVAWGPSAGTTNWLIAHLPFYRGYREPQKWLMLLALAYAYCAAVGTAGLLERLKGERAEYRPYLAGAAALLPIVWVPILLWGGGGQLKAVQYPADWYTAKAILNKRAGDSPVVVLPWHVYLRLDFAGRVVANPARNFFAQNVVTGNDPELPGVPPAGGTPLQDAINYKVLPRGPRDRHAVGQLQRFGVRYIVLYKESNWDRYGWLNQQQDLKLAYDGPHIRLYQLPAGAK